MAQTMAETRTTDAERISRCKRLRYRAWHRGTREMDLLLGPFADSFSDSRSQDELAAFERLLERRDDELHELILQNGVLAGNQENALLETLRAFHMKTNS
jgi:antitoxin CptB